MAYHSTIVFDKIKCVCGYALCCGAWSIFEVLGFMLKQNFVSDWKSAESLLIVFVPED